MGLMKQRHDWRSPAIKLPENLESYLVENFKNDISYGLTSVV